MRLSAFVFLYGAPLAALRRTSFLWDLSGARRSARASVFGPLAQTQGEEGPLLIRAMVAASSAPMKTQDLSLSPGGAKSKRLRQTRNNSSSTRPSPCSCLPPVAGDVSANEQAGCSRSPSSGPFNQDEPQPSKVRRRLKSDSSSDPPVPEELRKSGDMASGFGLLKDQNAKTGGKAAVCGGSSFAVDAASRPPAEEEPPGSPGESWRDLSVSPEELRPSSCLTTGNGTLPAQAVPPPILAGHKSRHPSHQQKQFHRCVFDGEATTGNPPWTPETLERQEEALRKFFQLHVPFGEMLEMWGLKGSSGVRVLAIDPVECLFSFICSSNNNIPRITLMVRRLRETYGLPLIKAGDKGPSESARLTWHAFPSVASLAASSVEELCRLGLGYRARLLHGSALRLMELGGISFLEALRWQQREAEAPPFESLKKATDALLQFPGVGKKVADCVALYGLGFAAAWPVDTHLLQHALEDKEFHSYISPCGPPEKLRAAKSDVVAKHLKRKQLSPQLHAAIQTFYQNKYGPFAGWAQSALFTQALRRPKSGK